MEIVCAATSEQVRMPQYYILRNLSLSPSFSVFLVRVSLATPSLAVYRQSDPRMPRTKLFTVEHLWTDFKSDLEPSKKMLKTHWSIMWSQETLNEMPTRRKAAVAAAAFTRTLLDINPQPVRPIPTKQIILGSSDCKPEMISFPTKKHRTSGYFGHQGITDYCC